MAHPTRHAMLQLRDHYRYKLGSNLGQLLLPHASRAETSSCAVGTYPSGVLLSLLERNIVVILQAEAAKLFGAAEVNGLFILLPLLLVFEELTHHYHVDQVGELWLHVGQLDSVDYLRGGEHDAVLARVIFAGAHDVGHFVLFTVVAEVVVIKFYFGTGTATDGLRLIYFYICRRLKLFVGKLLGF